ncbi:hypothetical protein D3C81_1409070 [compost metagenome]
MAQPRGTVRVNRALADWCLVVCFLGVFEDLPVINLGTVSYLQMFGVNPGLEPL